MKILMISDVYFPRVNGVSTSIASFRNELRRLGHEVWLIAPDYPGHVEHDPHIIRLPAPAVPGDPEDRIMPPHRVFKLLPQLRLQRFDLVHIHTPFTAHYAGRRLARRLGLPCIETYHTLFEEYGAHYFPIVPKAWMRAGTRALSRRQCNGVDTVIAPSRAMADALHRYGVTTPTVILPTGLDLREMAGGDGDAFRQRLGLAPGRPTLVHVGRVAFEKNLGFLLEAIAAVRARLPEVVCLLAGEGPALPWLRREIERLGLQENVRLLGYLKRDGALQSCYQAGDVFVFSSRTETQGLVLLEAMALGVPVVAQSVMGTRDILEPGRGCRVAKDSVTDFADQVLALLGDTELRRRVGEEAVAYAREWSTQAMTARLLEVYARLCGAPEAEAVTVAS